MRKPLALLTGADPDAREHDIDNPPATRSEAGRDRDRVLYSSAFQRLGHVTQVTAAETGLSFHSRLTHSLKVAQFARRLAERLEDDTYTGPAAEAIALLDPDAAEAAALAHDLGHPPFGHLAETELNGSARSFGGFEGNAQSFRIVTRLALRSGEYDGLNLTRRTLNGMVKYPWLRNLDDQKKSAKWNAYGADEPAYKWVREGLSSSSERTLEAEIMDWADDVTYAVHDMDDFYRAGFVPLEKLASPGPELDAFIAYVAQKVGDKADDYEKTTRTLLRNALYGFEAAYTASTADRVRVRQSGSELITRYIEAPSVESNGGRAEFVISPDLRREVDVLKELIWFYVIERPSLALIQAGQARIVRRLYKLYSEAAEADDVRLFAPYYREQLATAKTPDAKDRVVVDLIASLTEDGATSIYRKLMGVTTGSVTDAAGRLS